MKWILLSLLLTSCAETVLEVSVLRNARDKLYSCSAEYNRYMLIGRVCEEVGEYICSKEGEEKKPIFTQRLRTENRFYLEDYRFYCRSNL